MTNEQSQRSSTTERSMLTVVRRKHKNEAMGVGAHGCTLIMLNLQGIETHGSKTELVGLSRVMLNSRSHNWDTQIRASKARSYRCLFQMLSFVSCECSRSNYKCFQKKKEKKSPSIFFICSQRQLYIEIIKLVATLQGWYTIKQRVHVAFFFILIRWIQYGGKGKKTLVAFFISFCQKVLSQLETTPCNWLGRNHAVFSIWWETRTMVARPSLDSPPL